MLVQYDTSIRTCKYMQCAVHLHTKNRRGSTQTADDRDTPQHSISPSGPPDRHITCHLGQSPKQNVSQRPASRVPAPIPPPRSPTTPPTDVTSLAKDQGRPPASDDGSPRKNRYSDPDYVASKRCPGAFPSRNAPSTAMRLHNRQPANPPAIRGGYAKFRHEPWYPDVPIHPPPPPAAPLLIPPHPPHAAEERKMCTIFPWGGVCGLAPFPIWQPVWDPIRRGGSRRGANTKCVASALEPIAPSPAERSERTLPYPWHGRRLAGLTARDGGPR